MVSGNPGEPIDFLDEVCYSCINNLESGCIWGYHSLGKDLEGRGLVGLMANLANTPMMMKAIQWEPLIERVSNELDTSYRIPLEHGFALWRYSNFFAVEKELDDGAYRVTVHREPKALGENPENIWTVLGRGPFSGENVMVAFTRACKILSPECVEEDWWDEVAVMASLSLAQFQN